MSSEFKIVLMSMIYIFGAITLNSIVSFGEPGDNSGESFGAFMLQAVWAAPFFLLGLPFYAISKWNTRHEGGE